jgi:hypothetical protein
MGKVTISYTSVIEMFARIKAIIFEGALSFA